MVSSTQRHRVGRRVVCLALVGLGLHGLIPAVAAEPKLEMVYQLPLAPAGLTITADNHFLMSVSREERPQNRIIEVGKGGTSRPFPTTDISQASSGQPLLLDAVEGMQIDKAGIVWMLDNGRRSEYPPKVVAWDTAKHKLHRVYHMAFPAVLPGSLLDDLAVDPEAPFVYISDPAAGADAALVVLDLTTGLAHRVLQGHPSVVPVAGLELTIDGHKVETRRLDGTVADPQGGVSALTLDKKGEWLYFAPVRSLKLYRVRTEHLRDVNMLPEKLAGLVEEYSAKPVSDGMSMDSKGNIYVSDLASKGIGVIAAGKKDYRILAAEPRLLWPAGLCFGADGWLYFYTNTARTRPMPRPPLTAGTPLDASGINMNYLFRLETPVSGRVGD